MDIQPLPTLGLGAQAQTPRDAPARTAAGTPAASPASVPTTEVLEQAIKEIQANVENTQTNLRFRVDEASGKIVVSVVDAETKQVVRQIPSEEVMKLARIMDRLQGLLVNGKA